MIIYVIRGYRSRKSTRGKPVSEMSDTLKAFESKDDAFDYVGEHEDDLLATYEIVGIEEVDLVRME